MAGKRRRAVPVDDPAFARWTIRVACSDVDCIAILRGELPAHVLPQLQTEIRASLKACREQGLDWLNVDDFGTPKGAR